MATKTSKMPAKRKTKACPSNCADSSALGGLGEEVILHYDDGRIGKCVIVNDVYEVEEMVVFAGDEFTIGEVRIWDTSRLHLLNADNNVLLRWETTQIARLLKAEPGTQINKPKGKKGK